MMARFVCNAPVNGRGPAFDVAAVAEAPRLGRTGGGLFAPLGFARNIAQGACAGLLTLLGATHLSGALTATGEPIAADPASLAAIGETLLAGGLPGVIEIIGAIALFLNAGRGMGRILGLMAFVAIVVAHANGVDHLEAVEQFRQLAGALGEALTRFGAGAGV